MQLIEIKKIEGIITLESGLHIGAGDTEMKIGGTDNPVIKHPHTNEPYIPGSSLKGKIRSLLEMRSGLMVKTDGKPLGHKHLIGLEGKQKTDCENILKLFGASGSEKDENEIGPCRASFADCPLEEEWKKEALSEQRALTEVKSENSIDRIKGTVTPGGPRFTERVPAGTHFRFSIALKKLSDAENLEDYLLQGMKLLELDALGGNGSRGYGQIKFVFEDNSLQARFDTIEPFQEV